MIFKHRINAAALAGQAAAVFLSIVFFSASLLFSFLFFASPALADQDLKVGDVVVSVEEGLKAYESLEQAKAGGETEAFIDPPADTLTMHGPGSYNHSYKISEIQGDLAKVADSDDEEAFRWVKAGGLALLADYLKDPANKDITMACPDDLPRRLTVTLDSGHKKAVLKLNVIPELNGGLINLEVWDAAEKSKMWNSRDTADPDKEEDDKVEFDCHLLCPSTPEIIGDVDGDGRAEILSTSPLACRHEYGVFDRARWTGRAFEPLPEFFMVVSGNKMPKKGKLNQPPADGKDYISLDSMQELAPNGRIKGTFSLNFAPNKDKMRQEGTGWFRIDAAGKNFTFEGWIEPLRAIGE